MNSMALNPTLTRIVPPMSVVFLLLLLLTCLSGIAQPTDSIPLRHGAHRIGNRTDSDMAHWRDYGLGQFIHWGLYAIPGGFWHGQPVNGAAEWIRSSKKVDPKEYDALISQFNPVKYDPVAWALMAKNMGTKYVTFTTKHHDGFCLWPSKYSDFTIMQSPWKKDIIKPFVEAYNKQGIDVYLYFSIMDWHNPDWRYELKTKSDSVAFDRFKEFTKNQLTELLTLYPTTKGLWFDGTWDKSWKASGAFSDELEQYLKKLRPGLVIGSRLRADEKGNRHLDANGRLMGDYHQVWERKIPETIAEVKGYDWECVMTVPENQWGYNARWSGHVKSSSEIIEMLANCVSKGGNFVLNFGPKGDGSFREEEIRLAKEIGNWMAVNGEAIYAAGQSDFRKEDWGYYTKSKTSGKTYMVVFNTPVTNMLKVNIPKNQKIASQKLLGSKQVLPLEHIEGRMHYIRLPGGVRQQPAVIELQLISDDQKKELDVPKT
ncbi:alpha-L-fucosidase [Fibrella aestuarina BUZ 2]|uniref:alpha-L-fucosidase n=1 Tax=Fibrella aestuarina BUZ 2 TaxID=1166018 RepID=I0KD75_9BACT|nr:alpha-L-fucosidase [Fibrella aestuarina]CCH02078.1 alpha-L-fucosidase [Fibrella aestuarina BUZ 2]